MGKDNLMLFLSVHLWSDCAATCVNDHTTTTHTHTLPPLVFVVLGCQHSGSALHGGWRAVPGNRWWWPGGWAAGHRGSGQSENAADPLASAGREQAKSWCRVFLLRWNKHCITLLEGKVAPTAQCWWKMEGSQLLGCCSSQLQTCCHHVDIFRSWLCGCGMRTVDWQNYPTVLFSLCSGNVMMVLVWEFQVDNRLII